MISLSLYIYIYIYIHIYRCGVPTSHAMAIVWYGMACRNIYIYMHIYSYLYTHGYISIIHVIQCNIIIYIYIHLNNILGASVFCIDWRRSVRLRRLGGGGDTLRCAAGVYACMNMCVYIYTYIYIYIHTRESAHRVCFRAPRSNVSFGRYCFCVPARWLINALVVTVIVATIMIIIIIAAIVIAIVIANSLLHLYGSPSHIL